MNTTVFLVDDDDPMRESLTEIFEAKGFEVKAFACAEALLESCTASDAGCIVLDMKLPGMDGLQAQAALTELGISLPVIFLTGHGDVPMSVRAMKGGAIDFMEKPVSAEKLIARVSAALSLSECQNEDVAKVHAARARLAQLTQRETDILEDVLKGKANKQIARDLGISTRTVEVHRRNIAQKTGTRHLLELVRMFQLARSCPEFCARTPGDCRRRWGHPVVLSPAAE